MTEDESTAKPEKGDEDVPDRLEELREELAKPVEEEREQLRRASERLRQVMNPQIQSMLRDINRTGALAKLAADMNKRGLPILPDSTLKGVLGKNFPSTAFRTCWPRWLWSPLGRSTWIR